MEQWKMQIKKNVDEFHKKDRQNWFCITQIYISSPVCQYSTVYLSVRHLRCFLPWNISIRHPDFIDLVRHYQNYCLFPHSSHMHCQFFLLEIVTMHDLSNSIPIFRFILHLLRFKATMLFNLSFIRFPPLFNVDFIFILSVSFTIFMWGGD